MKNLKLFILSIAGIALLMNSCKRNENFDPLTSSSSQFARKSLVIGDSVTQDSCALYSFLKFRDKEAFLNTLKMLGDSSKTNDTILNDFEANFSQTTLRDDIISNNHDSMLSYIFGLNMSKLLATVVSDDSIIQIDSLAFLFDFNNNKIYEMYPVNCTNIALLKQKLEVNNDSTYILEYNIYDPIFHPSGYEAYTGKAFRWLRKLFGGCSDIWAGSSASRRDLDYTAIHGGDRKNFEVILAHSYYRFGVYFELGRSFQHNETGAYSKNVDVSLSHYDSWKEFCGGYGSNANWPNSIYGNNSRLSLYNYQSSNSLARNHNTVKTYIWFFPFGGSPDISSPSSISLPDLYF